MHINTQEFVVSRFHRNAVDLNSSHNNKKCINNVAVERGVAKNLMKYKKQIQKLIQRLQNVSANSV